MATARVALNDLVLTAGSSYPTLVAPGNIFFGGCGANRTITVLPSPNQSGTTTISITASDGATNSVASFLLTVNAINDPPTATNDTFTMAEDAALSPAAPGVLSNDNDPDGDVLRALLASAPLHGTLTLNTNGSFVYTPFTNYHGPDSFTYRAADAVSTSSVATVNLTITPLNDPPLAANDSFTTLEDTAINVPAGGVLTNDTDIDSGVLTAVLVTGPVRGSLSLNLDGSFSYTPTNDFNGTDSFTYRASDGISNSGIATVTLVVQPVNDAPAISSIANQTTLAGVTLSGLALAVADAETPVANLVLAVYSANEALLPVTNIVIEGTGALRTLALTPVGNETGTSTIQIIVTDADAARATNTFTLTVVPAANLSVSAQTSADPAVAGYALHFTVTVTNHGPHSATNVVLTDLLPAGLTLLSAESSQGNCTNSAGTLTANLGVLPPAGQALITLRVKPISGGNITNNFVVTANEADPDPGNNSASLWIGVRADSDGDGLPDDWELAHSLQPDVAADASQDSDGDGLSNLEEYLAGTDPQSASSAFRIDSLELEASRAIHFQSVTGRVYTLYFNDALFSNAWLSIPWQSRVPGLGTLQFLHDTNPAPPSRMYRLGVELP